VFDVNHSVDQDWPTSTHRRATKFVKDSPQAHTCLYMYIEGGNEFTRRLLFTNSVTLKVPLSDKVVCITKLDKTQRDFGLLFAVLSDELQLVNIFLLIKLPYHVLKSFYILFVKLCYCNCSGDHWAEILPSRAACLPVLL